MDLYIKNMVCNRCIIVVREIFTSTGLEPVEVTLGKVSLSVTPSEIQTKEAEKKLLEVGFEILTDQKRKIIEKIKTTISESLQNDLSEKTMNFSQILTASVHKDYSYISRLFSEAEGITIEKYIIDQKIEKVKELLAYDEMNLNEIAFRLGYSSVAHLSSQFKKTTGFTPTAFKKLKDHHRKPYGT